VDQSHSRIYLFTIFGEWALSLEAMRPVHKYKVSVPETGEIGALSSIVNTYWNMLYWEPMRVYFQKGEVSA
jgi:uncharacterized membrane protein